MDLLRWGRSPWGEWVLTHVSWSLFWASLFAGVLFFVAHASYMLFSAHRKRASAETDALEAKYKNLPAKIERHSPGGAPVPLGDGGVDVHAAVHGVPADRRRQVRLGAVALDGRHRPDGVDPVPHRPRDVLPGLLVDLDRSEGHPGAEGRAAARVRPRRARGRRTASIRSATGCITRRSCSPGWAPSITGVLMIPRIRTGLVTRNPYYLSDVDVGHHLRDARPGRRRPRRPRHRARVLRDSPEKWWITKAMIFGFITRRQYLEHHEPSRWPVGARRLGEARGPGVSAAVTPPSSASRIDIIEEAYEFMLAYAAQGLSTRIRAATRAVRRVSSCTRCDAALAGLGDFLNSFIDRRRRRAGGAVPRVHHRHRSRRAAMRRPRAARAGAARRSARSWSTTSTRRFTCAHSSPISSSSTKSSSTADRSARTPTINAELAENAEDLEAPM